MGGQPIATVIWRCNFCSWLITPSVGTFDNWHCRKHANRSIGDRGRVEPRQVAALRRSEVASTRRTASAAGPVPSGTRHLARFDPAADRSLHWSRTRR